MKTLPNRITDLEGLFVREFRAYQALLNLAQKEQLILSGDEISGLLSLTSEKADLLDDLAVLEGDKFGALSDFGLRVGGAPRAVQTLKLVRFLETIERQRANRLLHLQQGTLVIVGQVREVTCVNRALAAAALERANSLQAYLLDQYRLFLDGGRPSDKGLALEETPYQKSQAALPAIFSALIAARDAIQTNDATTIAVAVDDLHLALEQMQGLPAWDDGLDARQDIPQPPGLPQNDTSLVEVIATLYRQGTAYQASLDVSNRMLAVG